MAVRALAVSAAACTALVLATAWVFEMPLAEAAVAAPLIVAAAGALGFILVLWTRVLVDTLRRQRHPGRIVAAGAAVFAVLVVLSFFVDLPARH